MILTKMIKINPCSTVIKTILAELPWISNGCLITNWSNMNERAPGGWPMNSNIFKDLYNISVGWLNRKIMTERNPCMNTIWGHFVWAQNIWTVKEGLQNTHLRTPPSYRRPSRRLQIFGLKFDFEKFNLVEGANPLWKLWQIQQKFSPLFSIKC